MFRGALQTVSLVLSVACACSSRAQNTFTVTAELEARSAQASQPSFPSAVLWLKPLDVPHTLPFSSRAAYALVQKNKMFSPHLLVVPVGSAVAFPNRDPFFHNVFSLFEGRRFDLGLYEAGKTKDVVFSREGVSYIFCNIHPEMSAVVISLTTPLFSEADANGRFHIPGVLAGEYEVHLWVEGQSQATIDRWTGIVHVTAFAADLGPFLVLHTSAKQQHTDKFGQPYAPESDRKY